MGTGESNQGERLACSRQRKSKEPSVAGKEEERDGEMAGGASREGAGLDHGGPVGRCEPLAFLGVRWEPLEGSGNRGHTISIHMDHSGCWTWMVSRVK